MALGLAFTACSKEEVPIYDAEKSNFILFTYPEESYSIFSFSFHPEVEANGSIEIAVPIEIMGMAKDYDREYKVTVVDTMTTAKQGVHFELPEKCIFRAGQYVDTLSCAPVSVSNIGAHIKKERYKVSFNREKKSESESRSVVSDSLRPM